MRRILFSTVVLSVCALMAAGSLAGASAQSFSSNSSSSSMSSSAALPCGPLRMMCMQGTQAQCVGTQWQCIPTSSSSSNSVASCGANTLLCAIGGTPACVNGQWKCEPLVAPTITDAVKRLLDLTLKRLTDRLSARGIVCPSGSPVGIVGCAVLNRLQIRIDRIEGNTSSSSSSVSSRSSSSVSSRSSSSVSSGSSSSQGALDTLSDTTLLSSTTQLEGKTSVIAASAQIFINEEPVDVTDISISVSGDTSGIDDFLVYDDSRHLLGRATLQSGQYKLHLTGTAFSIPKAQSRSFYVRADLSSYDRTKTSGQLFSVNEMTVQATGEWSNEQYTKTFNDTFPAIAGARAMFTQIKATGATSDFVHDGTSVPLITLDIKGQMADSAARLAVQTLVFTISSNGVTVTNPVLTVPGTGVQTSCSVSGNSITCSAIPSGLGTINNETTLELRGDVSVSGTTSNPYLQVSLQNPGDPGTTGDITWTDGTTTFTWVPNDAPVARGTLFSQQ